MNFSLDTVVLSAALIALLVIIFVIYRRKNALKKRVESKISMFKKSL